MVLGRFVQGDIRSLARVMPLEAKQLSSIKLPGVPHHAPHRWRLASGWF